MTSPTAPSRRVILERRVLAVAIAIAAAALVWLAFFRSSDDDSGAGTPALATAGVSPEVAEMAQS
ncbi:MAG TPA: hypothetical protein VD761_02040, partial [Solirubrobacterales bacterium]|nr:hypothetical protein [Solirubrobacterales bacterium]